MAVHTRNSIGPDQMRNAAGVGDGSQGRRRISEKKSGSDVDADKRLVHATNTAPSTSSGSSQRGGRNATRAAPPSPVTASQPSDTHAAHPADADAMRATADARGMNAWNRTHQTRLQRRSRVARVKPL